MKYALLKRIKTDVNFRIKSFLLLSIIFNLLYSIFLFSISQIFFSTWFFVMSIYYGLLSVARIFMFFQTRLNSGKRKKIIIMRNSGCFLLLLNLVVSIMMFLLIYTTQGVSHHKITVITLATYTFAALTMAIISFVKYFKYNDSLYFSIKVVGLISASVSIVTLTNTMLTTFGEDKVILRSVILPVLSAFVSIFIIFCAIIMIVKATTKLRLLKNEQE